MRSGSPELVLADIERFDGGEQVASDPVEDLLGAGVSAADVRSGDAIEEVMYVAAADQIRIHVACSCVRDR